jgi:glycosyltransferase involved in cell wall biosynthesis
LISAGAAEDRIRFVDNFSTDPGPRSTPPSASNQVLIVGRLSHEKGIHQAIEAWLSASPKLELKVIGSGPMELQLRQLAGDSVQFLGQLHRDEVVHEMMVSRALLFPSIVFESQPMVLLEALAAGLPVVATDHPPSRWILQDSHAGILVRPQSSRAIIEAVSQLEDGDALDAMGVSARSTWSRRFTPQCAIGALEDLYGAAIDAHRT